ncbi:hypothetical protein IAT38_003419 [Cryptococcus sp. DSM 104549]
MSYDYIASGIGGEVSDQTISASGPLKPHWHLHPLPLSQLNPTTPTSRVFPAGRPPSLHSFCLHTISTSFHTYSPSDLSSLPPLLARRVLSRVRADRGHEDWQPEGERAFLPDEATIWAFGAICLPGEDGGQRFNLALPQGGVLARLPPNPAFPSSPHPLIELPQLFLRAPAPTAMGFTLLTSLTLDGTDGSVNDTSIQSLKWCTHLAALWTTGCKLSDAGVKLLASALELPDRARGEEGRGLWRLRAWFLGGCKRVSDRSAKSFARWPGLVLLDLRDTSCTEAALGIHTRTNSTLFGPTTPAFQPCTDGLVPLFATSLTPAEILESLCLTLIRLPRGDDAEEEVGRQGPKMISLNISPAPADRTIPPNHLPFPAPTPSNPPSSQPSQSGSVFRTAGVGTIYGASVSRVSDEATSFREDTKTALRLAYEDEVYARMTPEEQKKADAKAERERKAAWSGGGKIDRRKVDINGSGGGGAKGITSGKVYKPRLVTTQAAREREAVLEMERRGMGEDWWAESTDERARAFTVGAAASKPAPGSTSAAAVAARGKAALLAHSRLVKEEAARGEGAGDRRVMLVRMVDDGWEEMQWIRGGAGGAGGEMGWATGVLRGVKKGRGVEEMLGLGGSSGAGEAGGERLVAGLMGERRSSPPATPRQPVVSHNPFRAKVAPRPEAAAAPDIKPSQASSSPAPPASSGTSAGPSTSAAGPGSSAAQKGTFAATAAGVKTAVGPGPSSSSSTSTSTVSKTSTKPAPPKKFNPFARIRPSAKLPKPAPKAPPKPSMFNAKASSLTHPWFANGKAAAAGGVPAAAGAGGTGGTGAGVGGRPEVGRPAVGAAAAARTPGRNPLAPKPKVASSSSPAPTRPPSSHSAFRQPPQASSSPNPSQGTYPPSSPPASLATYTSSPGFPPSSQPRPSPSSDGGGELSFDAFDAPGKRKRVWGAGGVGEEGVRRRGMKMFDASMK